MEDKPRLIIQVERRINRMGSISTRMEIDGKIVSLKAFFRKLYDIYLKEPEAGSSTYGYARKHLTTFQKNPGKDVTPTGIGAILQNEYAGFAHCIGKEVLDALIAGHSDSYVLIDSPGGLLAVANLISDFLRFVHHQSGTSRTYATNVAGSAAMGLFSMGDESYALQDSRFAIHLSTAASDIIDPPGAQLKKSVRERKLAERAGIRKLEMDNFYMYFYYASHPDYEEDVLRRIEQAEMDPENPDAAVYFHGSELREWGIIDDVFPDVAALQAHFKDSVGASPFAEDPQVKHFFDVSERIVPEAKKLTPRHLWYSIHDLRKKYRAEYD